MFTVPGSMWLPCLRTECPSWRWRRRSARQTAVKWRSTTSDHRYCQYLALHPAWFGTRNTQFLMTSHIQPQLFHLFLDSMTKVMGSVGTYRHIHIKPCKNNAIAHSVVWCRGLKHGPWATWDPTNYCVSPLRKFCSDHRMWSSRMDGISFLNLQD